LLVEALEHTGGDLALEARVHSHIAGMGDMEPVMAPRSAMRAAEIVSGVEVDPDHVACALLDRAFHHLLMGQPATSDDIDRGLRLFTGNGASFEARRAQEVAERVLFHLGRFHEALALDETEYRRLTETGQYGLLPPLVQSLSVLTQLTGDWAAARRYAQECADLVDQGEPAWRERALLAQGRILAWEGDLDAARAIAAPALARQEAAGDRWEATIFCALLGFTELSVPDAPRALRYLERALEHADAIEVVLPSQFRFLGDLVEAAVLSGDLDLAESVLTQRLEEPAARQPLPWTLAMARRGRGLVSAARGQVDEAVDWFGQALSVFDTTLAMPFERGRTVLARGQVHRRAGRWRAARSDLTGAHAVFDVLGAAAWRQRATQELDRVGGRPPTGAVLTPSERMVAGLAAAGRSNKEIAAELLISVRTVESQLSATYRKLGIRARTQLSATLGQPHQ
jgi:ATP/maltotriose-dependent transcriptional regulator MalT